MRLSPGTKLGPYEIVAPLGAGGMGEVYHARDPRLGRDVAIKVLPEHLSQDPQALSRFRREAQAVAALSHPAILSIFDTGTEQGVQFAVTELLEGETLRNLVSRGPIHWRKAVELAAAIADGLASVHAKGIIHRDLKPENLFLTSGSRVKVLDFGLARVRCPVSPQDETCTITGTEPGVVMGTVGYMSPEQVRGESADAPSDLFSLGCVLYELVSGRRAFARETAAQTLTAILEHEVPPLSEAGQSVPRELDRIVARCLAKDPAQRISSARDLSLALTEMLAEPITLRPSPPSPKHHLRTIALALAAITLVGVGGSYLYIRLDRPTGSIAVLPFANAGGNPDMDYLGDGITESLINSLSQAPNLTVMSRNAVFRYRGTGVDVQAAGRALNVTVVLTGRVVQHGENLSISAELVDVASNRQIWGERYNRKVTDILAVQEDISTEISDRLQLKLTGEEKRRVAKQYTKNTAAYQLYLKGRYHWNKKTPDGFQKGIEYFQKAIEEDPNYAPAYAGLAALYNNLANYNFALLPPREAWAKAKIAAQTALRIDDTLAAAHTSLALVAYQFEWDWQAAEREFKRSLDLDPGSPSTYEPSPSSTNHWYSHFLMSVGRNEDSLRTGRRALELDPLDLANNSHQGWHYVWTGDSRSAIEPLRKTIELEPNFHIAHWYLGMAYEQTGQFDDAISEFETSVRITRNRPLMMALLAHAHARANRKPEALEELRVLIDLSERQYVPSYPIAVVYAALDKKEDAFLWLERAFQERDSWMDYLKLDPRLVDLRTDPRFANLLKRLNLPR